MHLGLGSGSHEEIHLISNNWQAFATNTAASQLAKVGYRIRKETSFPTRKSKDTRCGQTAS